MAEIVSVLGSTGSIGTQALDVIRNIDGIHVIGLSAGGNTELLEKQILEFKPLKAAVAEKENAVRLRERLKGFSETEIVYGLDGLMEIATLKRADTVINSVVGSVGLLPTIEAIKAKKDIALANKETLVTGGELIMRLVAEYGVKLIPVDSEHSAIFQCLAGNEGNRIKKIYLTASGGPFLGKTLNEMNNVTVEDALKHPNWNMGKKITIDSATLMNKGLEFIEAKWLFGLEISQIEVLVHRESVIHSMIEFDDGAVMAQLGAADMRIPIQYSLTYPRRAKNDFDRIDFHLHNALSFNRPDYENFPCLGLAVRALEKGSVYPAILNAANECAVDYFLKKKIKFTDIGFIIENTLSSYNDEKSSDECISLKDIIEAEKWTREHVASMELCDNRER